MVCRLSNLPVDGHSARSYRTAGTEIQRGHACQARGQNHGRPVSSEPGRQVDSEAFLPASITVHLAVS